jgi:hypothetical protein
MPVVNTSAEEREGRKKKGKDYYYYFCPFHYATFVNVQIYVVFVTLLYSLN